MTYTVNKDNIRKCCLNRKHYPKKELFRINVTKQDEISLDLEYIKKGRGYYIHKDLKSINISKKALKNILKKEVPEVIFSEMENSLK